MIAVLDFRRLQTADGARPGWFWHQWAYWLQHGGWFYLQPTHPIATLRWWWRFCVTIPRSRGWRWD
jgi:hypothetical protein